MTVKVFTTLMLPFNKYLKKSYVQYSYARNVSFLFHYSSRIASSRGNSPIGLHREDNGSQRFCEFYFRREFLWSIRFATTHLLSVFCHLPGYFKNRSQDCVSLIKRPEHCHRLRQWAFTIVRSSDKFIWFLFQITDLDELGIFHLSTWNQAWRHASQKSDLYFEA